MAGVPLEFEHTSGGGSCAPRIPSAFHAHEDGARESRWPRPVTAPHDEIEKLAGELRAARQHITDLEAELQALRAELSDATGSASARIAVAVVRKARRVVPPEFVASRPCIKRPPER